MKPNLLMAIILPAFLCLDTQQTAVSKKTGPFKTDLSQNPYPFIGSIPLPAGYRRVREPANGFGEWLRGIPLKKDTRVRLFDGTLKANQSAQFAVLDLSVGKRDLQQCADAVMRLRAEYLYLRGMYDDLVFYDNIGHPYRLGSNRDRRHFDRFLEGVFAGCGTLSLQRQLKVTRWDQIRAGDVIIRGGSPGHAMMIADMAVNESGQKIFLLAQSYMPAQDIHLVVNPDPGSPSPWYILREGPVQTPEWLFPSGRFRTWP